MIPCLHIFLFSFFISYPSCKNDNVYLFKVDNGQNNICAKERSMELKEKYEEYKKFKVPSSLEIREKASQHSKTSLVIIIILVALLLLALQYIPHYQVAQFNITNQKDLAEAENGYRATLAQIFGGIAIGIGLYYTWRRIGIAEEDLRATQENLKIAQEGQITERFTRAIEQLGNEKIEIRLGGIYALNRIANESKTDYWSIIEILTAYVREKSPIEVDKINSEENVAPKKLSLDIQAILTVIRRCKPSLNTDESKYFIGGDGFVVYDTDYIIEEANYIIEAASYLDFHETYLWKANLFDAHLQGANLERANLSEANLSNAKLERASLVKSNLKKASLYEAKLVGAFLMGAHLEEAKLYRADLKYCFLTGAHLEGADFQNADLELTFFLGAHLENADFFEVNLKKATLSNANLQGASLHRANLKEVDLTGAKNLTVDQLSKAKTLYKAKLDSELEEDLRKRGYGHLLDDEPK